MPKRLGPLIGALVLLALAAALFFGRSQPAPQSPPAAAPPTRSNVHPGDYVGPEVCAECHEEKYAQWRTHSHSRMNLDADEGSVLGDFSGVELEYAGGRVRFERSDGTYFMTLVDADEERRRYRVTRTVGSRFTQMYVGVLIEGPELPGHPAYVREGKLPFGYWIARGAWFPESYFDSDCPPEFDADGRVSLPAKEAHGTSWRRNCIYCHNTYPYEERLREGAGTTGFPEEDLHLVNDEDDAPGLRPEELVTLGISCESCHFGGREHALEDRSIRFLPTSPRLRFDKATPERVARAREDPYVVNSICAQCHFSRGVSPYPNGAGTWNSREAVDMLGGSCASQVKCTDCHDPHVAGPPGGGPDQPAHVQACLACHETLRDVAAREDHTQHGADVSCLDCHMPRIVQGLEAVVRTHRISAPGDPRMLAAGAPNACNLCHLDRSIEWTAAALRVGWGQSVQPEAAWSEAYGGRLDGPVGHRWLSSPVPSHRLVGADAYARSPLGKGELPRLIRTLDDPMAVNRMFGLFALERVLGRRLTDAEYTPTASPAARRAQVAKLLERHE